MAEAKKAPEADEKPTAAEKREQSAEEIKPTREAAPGEFFTSTVDADEQARIDELHRKAASAPLARSQWDG
jgi:hypothetical protein